MHKSGLLFFMLFSSAVYAADTEMTVHRSPSCSCCGRWLEHVKANGFKVKDLLQDDMDSVKEKLGVPEKLASCHTAEVNGYIIEGHVPAADIQKLLASKPNLTGIAAPGMPLSSPGMETPGHLDDPYPVVGFDKNQNFAIFTQH